MPPHGAEVPQVAEEELSLAFLIRTLQSETRSRAPGRTGASLGCGILRFKSVVAQHSLDLTKAQNTFRGSGCGDGVQVKAISQAGK